MHIVADIDGDVVIVDWIADKPVEPGIATREFLYPSETPVRDVDQSSGDADTDEHAIYFVRLVIFIGPPCARTQLLTCGRNPVIAIAVFLEVKPSVPRCPSSLHWMSRIVHGNFFPCSFCDGLGKIDEHGMVLPGERQ